MGRYSYQRCCLLRVPGLKNRLHSTVLCSSLATCR